LRRFEPICGQQRQALLKNRLRMAPRIVPSFLSPSDAESLRCMPTTFTVT
jgi:hypothetical protein